MRGQQIFFTAVVQAVNMVEYTFECIKLNGVSREDAKNATS